jgi:conjugative relaxase-like TrwC/TraI family protein
MIRKRWHYDAGAALDYHKVSDYHRAVTGEWFGKDAERLGLTEQAEWKDLEAVLGNRDPRTGESLTKFTRDGRRVALELNFNAVKDASIAAMLAGEGNQGDPLVIRCHREAVKHALSLVEKEMQVRDREDNRGDSKDNRPTGSMVAWMGTHFETRVNEDDFTPDPDLHEHVLIANLSLDSRAKNGRGAWKAIEVGDIVKKLPYYEAAYHNRMAYLLRTEGGYGIKKEGKAYGIVGIDKDTKSMFSRRRATIEAFRKEKEEEQDRKFTDKEADQFGAETRLGKTHLSDAELNGVWVGKLTAEQRQELASLKGRPSSGMDARTAATFAVEHEFHKASVVRQDKLYETALRHGMGWVTEDEIRGEFKRQGVLFVGGEATTAELDRQESVIKSFARDGKGSKRPAVPAVLDVATLIGDRGGPKVKLTDEQENALKALVLSRDAVNMVDAGQGTGKTTLLEHFGQVLASRGVKATWLGTTHTSVDQLTDKGLPATTLASFLASEQAKKNAAGSRIILDEASMLSHRDAYRLFDYARQSGCRIDLVGDVKQYRSPVAGTPMTLLTRFAGIESITMKKTMRQSGKLKIAMEAIRDDDVLKGHDVLSELGMVHEMPLVELVQKAADLYLDWTKNGESVPVISPTHAQADELAEKIRDGLKARGDLKGKDHEVRKLTNLNWSPAQLKHARENGAEGVVLLPYGAYAEEKQSLAKGDRVRTTMGGTSTTGKRIRAGRKFTVEGFTRDGGVRLSGGVIMPKSYGGLVQDYVGTGQNAQGMTAKRAIVVYGTPSLVATRMEGFYVPVSRVRKEVAVLTDSNKELREAIQRIEHKKTATELLAGLKRQKPPLRQRGLKLLSFLRRQAYFLSVHDRDGGHERSKRNEREVSYGR